MGDIQKVQNIFPYIYRLYELEDQMDEAEENVRAECEVRIGHTQEYPTMHYWNSPAYSVNDQYIRILLNISGNSRPKLYCGVLFKITSLQSPNFSPVSLSIRAC